VCGSDWSRGGAPGAIGEGQSHWWATKREREGGGRRSLPGGSHDAGSRVTGRWIRSCGSGLIGKELDFGFSFDLFS
jgi:hypothetical protein